MSKKNKSHMDIILGNSVLDFFKKVNWTNTSYFVDGWLPKLSLFVPIVGYLILFNDGVAKYVEFSNLSESANLYLSSSDRLKLIYFGLISLGVANFVYRIRKPMEFGHGENWLEYSKNCLDVYTHMDYVILISQIKKRERHTEQSFLDMDLWESKIGSTLNYQDGWKNIKEIHRDVLLSILWENFQYANMSRRVSLFSTVVLASAGYILLIIPSAELFFKVLLVTF